MRGEHLEPARPVVGIAREIPQAHLLRGRVGQSCHHPRLYAEAFEHARYDRRPKMGTTRPVAGVEPQR